MKKILITLTLALLAFNIFTFVGATDLVPEIETVYAADGDDNDGDGVPQPEDPDDDDPAVPGTGDDATAGGEEVEGDAPSQNLEDLITDGARSVLLNIQQLFAIILYVLNFAMWAVLWMIGALMDNNLIFGGGMEDRLLTVWAQIRNIINLGFVVILIGIALYNVLGLGGEEGNYGIKKLLPKIMIALILVNFTFVASKVILDGANVLTNAVFALPNAVEEEFSLTRIDEVEPAVCEALFRSTGFDETQYLQEGAENSFRLCEDENTFSATGRDFFSNLSSNNIALVMAINMAQIHKGIDVSELVLNDPNISNLTINILFSVALYFVHASAYIALFFVLLVRVVVLWIIIAVSPVIAVQIAIPEIGDKIGSQADLKGEFVKHAIAPIIIGFGMTLSYLMLDAYHRTSTAALGVQLGADFANAFSGTSSLQQLIVAIASVAVVFVVTFTAADNTAARAVTQRVSTFVKGIGRWAARQPLNAQIIPVSSEIDEDGKASLSEIFNTAQNRMAPRRDTLSGFTRQSNSSGNDSDSSDRRVFNNSSEIRRYVDQARLNSSERSAEALRSMYVVRNDITNQQALKIVEHLDPQENADAQPFIESRTDLINLRDRLRQEVEQGRGGSNVIIETNTIDRILRDRNAYTTDEEAFSGGDNNDSDSSDT